MEVEVKLRLPDSASHQKLSSLLSPFHSQTLIQHNIFFDGADSELTSQNAVLRLRLVGADDSLRCFLTLKSRPTIADGISRAEELEEPYDAAAGRACAAEPWRLLAAARDGSSSESEILRRVRDACGDLVCLGGFRNVRSVYDWRDGLRVELDESIYEFGTSYEIECESSEPEKAKAALENLLESNGIRFSYSKLSKFQVFRSQKLPEF